MGVDLFLHRSNKGEDVGACGVLIVHHKARVLGRHRRAPNPQPFQAGLLD